MKKWCWRRLRAQMSVRLLPLMLAASVCIPSGSLGQFRLVVSLLFFLRRGIKLVGYALQGFFNPGQADQGLCLPG
jgi:hypothetical protein